MYAVIVLKEMQKDVAKEHRVSPAVVSAYVRKCQQSNAYLRELMNKRDANLEHRKAISDVTDNLNTNGENIQNIT